MATRAEGSREIDIRGRLGNRDAQSGQSAKLRKYPGFFDAVCVCICYPGMLFLNWFIELIKFIEFIELIKLNELIK